MIKPLTKSQVNSGDFDQPPCPVKIKLIICSTPRSGSYLLCRAMIRHGIGVPHEYFNGINAGFISSRLGIDRVTSRELEVDDTANICAFGWKVRDFSLKGYASDEAR